MRKNLMMHVLPVRDNGAWQRNAEIIRENRDLFDGKRIIAIATNARGTMHRLDKPDVVKDAFGDGFEFIEVPNDKHLREVASFIPLMERIQDNNTPDDVTFFCHAKGCTHSVDPQHPISKWREAMYETCLHWPGVEAALREFPIAGSFRRTSVLGRSHWHYSGTFYWLRNRDVFSRNWQGIERAWFGTESFPGITFTKEESACMFFDDARDLYQPEEWERVEPALEAWRAANCVTSN
ncbi:MAG TPA: hypothetical protein VLA12_16745 [Planctomycetaceae bacterium]|nr:hypothetical protein [Planctomycetaceae bacterium]